MQILNTTYEYADQLLKNHNGDKNDAYQTLLAAVNADAPALRLVPRGWLIEVTAHIFTI